MYVCMVGTHHTCMDTTSGSTTVCIICTCFAHTRKKDRHTRIHTRTRRRRYAYMYRPYTCNKRDIKRHTDTTTVANYISDSNILTTSIQKSKTVSGKNERPKASFLLCGLAFSTPFHTFLPVSLRPREVLLLQLQEWFAYIILIHWNLDNKTQSARTQRVTIKLRHAMQRNMPSAHWPRLQR